MSYPHEVLAGGSMYAVQLPEIIPAAGTPGGPPLPENYRYFGGFPMDTRPIFVGCIRDPEQIEPTIVKMMDAFKAAQKKK
jgi:hypothetical protein